MAIIRHLNRRNCVISYPSQNRIDRSRGTVRRFRYVFYRFRFCYFFNNFTVELYYQRYRYYSIKKCISDVSRSDCLKFFRRLVEMWYWTSVTLQICHVTISLGCLNYCQCLLASKTAANKNITTGKKNTLIEFSWNNRTNVLDLFQGFLSHQISEKSQNLVIILYWRPESVCEKASSRSPAD